MKTFFCRINDVISIPIIYIQLIYTKLQINAFQVIVIKLKWKLTQIAGNKEKYPYGI